ncbi:SCO1664 family protein [Actinomadura flavalba]|uniref:SCO1664 family protein n=1 Tax=Actinomadura flavalba TaxID=1120938 RepID=UPI0003698580|nr:SCO1664 family protein [Actinomadura flavalba]
MTPSPDRSPAGNSVGDGARTAALPPPDPSDAREVAAVERLLTRGRLTVEGRLVQASNATLYCAVEHQGVRAACVYKPVAGERPLWDFPDGTLAEREVAAYAVSQALGWNVVPPTVHRDGPYGVGMVQLWVEPDPDIDLVTLSRSQDAAIRRMAVFDAVVNNADRKIGHLLPPGGGHVYGCDHGVCFSAEYKLRTVLWQWRGEALTDEAVDGLRRLVAALDGDLGARLSELLTGEEVTATRHRVELMLKHRVHPFPSEDWPAVPWPPL